MITFSAKLNLGMRTSEGVITDPTPIRRQAALTGALQVHTQLCHGDAV